MKRKELSDGWRKALVSAGAIDLVAGTTLEEFSRQEPGGLSPAPKNKNNTSQYGQSLYHMFAQTICCLCADREVLVFTAPELLGFD
jgi:hypothetical protein